MIRDTSKNLICYREIGKRIRDERLKREVTIRDMASEAGLNATALSSFERAERHIGLISLILVARYLQVSLDYLVFGQAAPDPLDEAGEELLQPDTLFSQCTAEEKRAIFQVMDSMAQAFCSVRDHENS